MPGKCRFQDKWLKEKDFCKWILRDAKNNNIARCAYCSTNISLTSMGEAALRSHVKSDRHKKNADRVEKDNRCTVSDFFGPVPKQTEASVCDAEASASSSSSTSKDRLRQVEDTSQRQTTLSG